MTPFEDLILVDSRAASRRPLPSCRSPHHRLRHDLSANAHVGGCWWFPRRTCRLTPRCSHRGFPTGLRNGSSAPSTGISSRLDTTTSTASPPLGGCPRSISAALSTSQWLPLGSGRRVLSNALSVDIGRRHVSQGVSPPRACATVMTPWSSTEPSPERDASWRTRRLLAGRPCAPAKVCRVLGLPLRGPLGALGCSLSADGVGSCLSTGSLRAARSRLKSSKEPSGDRVDLRPDR